MCIKQGTRGPNAQFRASVIYDPAQRCGRMISCVDLSNLSVTGCVTSPPALIQSPVYKATRLKLHDELNTLNKKKQYILAVT